MVCEKCWGDAYLRMRLHGKPQAECYLDLLAEREDAPCTKNEHDLHDCNHCGQSKSIGLPRVQDHKYVALFCHENGCQFLVLLHALKDLYETGKNANIPLANSKAVRKMGKFLVARDRTKELLEQMEKLI